jgi:hypothetical protein
LKQGKLLILDRKVNSHRQLRVFRGVICGLLGSAMLLAAVGVSAATYRWKDDDGQIIYSQHPPADGRPSSVIGAPPPPADAEHEKARLEALRQNQADNREDRELSREASQEASASKAAMTKNCEIGRKNLQTLQTQSIRRIRLADGTIKRLTPEERQDLIDEAKRKIKDNCP